MPASTRAAEVGLKLQRLRAHVAARGARGAVLTKVANVAWLSAGARTFINVAAEAGAAWVVVTPDRTAVLTNNIEAARLREEELAGLDWEVLACDWWEERGLERLLADVAGPAQGLLTDGGVPGTTDGAAEFAELRSALGAAEQARAAALGRDCGAALEACCRALVPGDTEFAVAGRLAAACYDRGVEPVVHLVAADARAWTRRHPLPTGAAVASYALVALCGMRDGLVMSCTRLVHFGRPPDDLLRRWRAAASVDAEMIAATRPGATAGDVFAAAEAAYRQTGFDGEWRHHHQGGLAGYASREWRAVPGGPQRVLPGQMFAWNPSVAGAKSEDTVLAAEAPGGAAAPRVLTETGGWPLATIGTRVGVAVRRPEILVR